MKVNKLFKLLMLFFSLSVLTNCGMTDGQRDGIPFISDNTIWGKQDEEQILKCETYRNCFPRKLDAVGACPMQCLLTTKGYGLPDAVIEAFSGKRPVKKSDRAYFIISYGPPGSGKSNIAQVLQSSGMAEFKELKETTADVNVDRIFQSGEVGRLFNSYRKEIIENTGENSKVYSQRLFAYYRWTADQISDLILNQALAGKMNITWETTGAKSFWIQREINRTRSYGYDSIVVYPMVATKDLIKRAQARTEQEAAPAERIIANVKSAQINLIALLPPNAALSRDPCPKGTTGYSPNDNDGCRATRIILIDNTKEKGQERIAFDTQNPDSTCNNFKALLHSLEEDFEPKLRAALALFFATNSLCRSL